MKILSVIVPCYNSQGHMHQCVDSLLAGGDNVEIIIVNDGSVDNTAAIANEYASRFPNIIKVIHQQNAGHGGAINAGLRVAAGLYVKVVDSDDWVDNDAYGKVLTTLLGFPPKKRPHLVINNYVYEKAGKKRKTVVRYKGVLPEGRLFTWDSMGSFQVGQYMLMHALIYRLDVLKKCSLSLPENAFYVDNYYAYAPMLEVETMFYINVNLYRYFIGREGQSVQEKTMIRRVDQQLAVNRLMLESISLSNVRSDKKRDYLAHYLEIVTAVSSILLLLEGTESSISKKDELWGFIKEKDAIIYDRLRRGLLGRFLHIPTPIGRSVAVLAYRVSRLIVGFN